MKRTSIKEKKTMRTCLALKPSTHENTMKILHCKGGTFNNLVNVLLEKFVSENLDYVAMYNGYKQMGYAV